MKYASTTFLFVMAMVWIAVSSASTAAEAPTILSPLAQRDEPPAKALPAHSKRMGAVTFDISALEPPADAKVAQDGAWLAPQLHFEPFPDVSFDAKGSRIEQDDFGNTTWVGKIDGVEDGVVILTTRGNRLVGRIDLGLSQYLLTGSADEGFWVSEIDPTSYRHANVGGRTDFLDALTSTRPAATANGFMLNGAGTGNTIDVLVLYSTHAQQQMGLLDPSVFVASLVADNNQSYINSSVDGAVRVVGYEGISGYVEPITQDDSAGRTEFRLIRSKMENGQGYFSNVPSLISEYRADLVVMFVDGTRIAYGPCGLSQLLEHLDGSDSDRVNIIVSTGCAIGDRTFTHEIGHALSGRHDIVFSHAQSPNPFDYDFGYSSSSPAFRTIMGSDDVGSSNCNSEDGCPRINRWSSLTQTYSGAPLGTTEAIDSKTYSTDMVTVLQTTFPIVAAYRNPAGLGAPGTPGTPLSWDCANTTNVIWGSASGTVGWYQAEWSTSGSPGSYNQVYKGSGRTFSSHFSSSGWFRVQACNANGCGTHTQSHISATGPGCEIGP